MKASLIAAGWIFANNVFEADLDKAIPNRHAAAVLFSLYVPIAR